MKISRYRWVRSTVIGVAALALADSAAAQTQGGAGQRAVVDRYCVTCHNQRNKANAGNLDLAAVDLSAPSKNADVFEKVLAKLKAGQMPPIGQRRPTPAERTDLVAYLETELDRAARISPDPGRTEAFHRLNRAEYQNAVRDLLDLNLVVAPLLPADDASFGFDNNAGVLKISQSRLEQYLAVARKVSRAAIGSPLPAPATSQYRVPETANQYDRIDGLPFGTRGGMQVHHHFPQDGEYELRIELRCRRAGECDGSAGFPDTHRMLALVDGATARAYTLEARDVYRSPEERIWRVRVPLKAGPHDIAVAFEKLPSIEEADGVVQRFMRPYYPNGVFGAPNNTIYQPHLEGFEIVGPFNATGAGQTPSRRRIFVCQPSPAASARSRRSSPDVQESEDGCAATIIRSLARRAFRRPVAEAEVAPLLDLYKQDAAQGGFELGIEAALQALLVRPEFLYRVERDPAGTPAGTSYRLSDLALASRLSFFLWSSIPDEALLAAAERGQLKNAAVLERHVRRMLADPRADALVENFAGQWLWLRNLDAHRPDLPLFPNFDDTLRAASRRETELFFGAVLRENRPVTELLTADYTFVNERLARHYGMPGIYGDEFRRVKQVDARRRGLLGHASILTATSRPNRTSPVIRGKWILDNIMGTPAPEPPAEVPALKEDDAGSRAKIGTMRERMTAHRVNPVCAGCHALLEPPGLALENFDGIGQWRDFDESATPVDASGSLPDGTKFDGLEAFRATLARDPDVFATTVTKKLLIYALGRGLEAHDMPTVRRIVRERKPAGLTLSGIVVGIVRSAPFQMRRAAVD